MYDRNTNKRRTTYHAYAKINLYLDILSRRTDGYHDLLTVMHSLSLRDDVTVEVLPCPTTNISMRVFGSYLLPTDERNLAYRAADAFLRRIGKTARVRIDIRKRIPIAAGLAGGSSDAAATLRALNALMGHPLGKSALLSLATTLGSDVPYCLVGGTQICRGKGEKMQPISCKTPLHAVVAIGGKEHIATPRAFADADAYYADFDGSVPHGSDPDGLYAALAAGDIDALGAHIYNAFEPVVLPSCPLASALKEKMLALGAYAAHMSGSGPSVFGLFRTREEANRVATALGKGAYAVSSVL
ncbi:MAG: 4-(cytidine 5'-diphospho)-2-C-methyl-D-erythritol kinase [Clostridia bacterium]|nr:4-(cytidine 5'-diphospho)-2-C-methyl-D-erythritol kinase [Clostridia bacterium]